MNTKQWCLCECSLFWMQDSAKLQDALQAPPLIELDLDFGARAVRRHLARLALWMEAEFNKVGGRLR